MTRPTLVTGAAGFAGSHLLDALSGDGIETIAWHRPGGSRPREARGVRWQTVDLLDRTAVARAIAAVNPATVYHCAGAAHVGRSWRSSEQTLAVNVLGTHHIIEGLREAAADARLLIPGSAMVYAAADEPLTEDHPLVPSSPYGLSKLAQEKAGCNNGGRPAVFLARPFNHFGVRQDPWFVTSGFAQRIAEIEAGHRDPVLAVGNLEARRDLTDVRDVVRAYRLIVEQGVPERPYNVCTGDAVAIRDLLDMFLSRARVRVEVTIDPGRYRPNDLPLVVGDNSRIRSELGWTPTISMEQTVDELLEYWRGQAAVRTGSST
jgi:GDP-4-dehydro-6-deoxy-D-mannose reductase